MGVYIRGMEMPKNCGDCKAFVCYKQWAGDVGDCFCGITKNDAEAKKKNADCPLVSLPPHGRLIEENKVLDIVSAWCPDDDGSVGKDGDLREMLDEIEALPTIIPAEENNNDR